MTSCIYAGNRNVCTNADVVLASDALVVIPMREFYAWTNIKVVDLSAAVAATTIQTEAFASCTNIERVILPPNLIEIATMAFIYCRSLKNITLSASLETLGSRFLEGCTQLELVNFEPGLKVTALPSRCFLDTKITTFALWQSLESIVPDSFQNTRLMTITNPEDNTHFQIIDGVLYKDTTLIMCPQGWEGSFVIPSFVEATGQSSFAGSRLSSVSFEPNSSMKTLGSLMMYAAAITSFEFPDSPDCTIVSTQMLNACTKLTSLTLSKYIKQLGQASFLSAPIAEIIVPEDSLWLTSKDGVVYSKDFATLWCFPPAMVKDNYTIPKSVTTIANSACIGMSCPLFFEPGSQLSSIGIYTFSSFRYPVFAFDVDCPLTNIPAYAFSSAKIEEIVLPKGLETMDGSAFVGTLIASFTMPADALYMTSVDGVLYSKDMTTLFRFPPLKTGDYHVPAAVVTIGRSAFNACSGITELNFELDSNLTTLQYRAFISSSITRITFPQNGENVVFDTECFASSSVHSITMPGLMKNIRKDMFKDCTSLVEIKLPQCIETIGETAFQNCASLTNLDIPQYAQLVSIAADAFKGAQKLTFLRLSYRVTTISKLALPANLKHVTLYCPPSNSITESLAWLVSLEKIDILCNHEIDTSNFASQNIIVTHICNTLKLDVSLTKIMVRCFMTWHSFLLIPH